MTRTPSLERDLGLVRAQRVADEPGDPDRLPLRHRDQGHVVPPVDGEQSAADRCGQPGDRRMEALVAALRGEAGEHSVEHLGFVAAQWANVDVSVGVSVDFHGPTVRRGGSNRLAAG